MVNWGNLFIFADSPFISLNLILRLIENYGPIKGYWTQYERNSQGHFLVEEPRKAAKERRRVIRNGTKISISISNHFKKLINGNIDTSNPKSDDFSEFFESFEEDNLEFIEEESEDENFYLREERETVNLTHNEEFDQEEVIHYKTLDSENWLKTPIILKLDKENDLITNKEKLNYVTEEIKGIIFKEINHLHKFKIIEADLREFLLKSTNYTYLKTYQEYNTLPKRNIQELQNQIIQKLQENEWQIDSTLKRTIKYKNSKEYTDLNQKKIIKIKNSNKIVIKKPHLNIFETRSAIQNWDVLRMIQKGGHKMEIWDRKAMIQTIFDECKQNIERIPSSIQIKLLDPDENLLEKLKGKKRYLIEEYSTNIASININGLLKLGKTQELEQLLLSQKIEILMEKRNLKKEVYGEKKSKGGLCIAIRKEFKKFFEEIKHEDQDILHIKITDLHIINCYLRQKTQKEMLRKLQAIIQNIQTEKYIIGGDFNLTQEEIEKQITIQNFKIIPNESISRTRNIDHFCVNNELEINNSQIIDTTAKKLSDHKMLLNKISFKTPITTQLQYYQPTQEEFQNKIIKKMEEEAFPSSKLVLSTNIIKDMKNSFRKKNTIHIETKSELDYQLHNFLEEKEFNWKKLLNKKWKKTMKGIEIDNRNELNYWAEIKRITQKKTRVVLGTPKMEQDFQQMINSIRLLPSQITIEKIKTSNIEILEDTRELNLLFPLERLSKIIKTCKNNSTCDYDKIDMYKNPYINETDSRYQEFLKSINRMFKKWISNPNDEIIEYIQERRMIFIYKQGNPEEIKNYRPISINNSTARFFLKRILEEIEHIWEKINFQNIFK
ncbi:hypothetical protein M0811_12247 [Anaeramoeba ignava]|uniref:Endonuclease/exonuclease/phosphatase domain-containing protein n=1 Tax=Anaeramoeba ignava TaxID=1746090 RepID=A0A9Q0L9C3_ANAIG|nr:hypothetical protein M0811_12247 [Anaeramoeba ignava]